MHQLVENYPGCAEALTEAERINPNNPDIFSQKGQVNNLNSVEKFYALFRKFGINFSDASGDERYQSSVGRFRKGCRFET